MAAGPVARGSTREALAGKIVFAFALAKRDEVGWNDHERLSSVRLRRGSSILILDDIDICQYSAPK